MKGRASRAVYMRLQPSLLSPPSDPEEREKKKREQKKTAPVQKTREEGIWVEVSSSRPCVALTLRVRVPDNHILS